MKASLILLAVLLPLGARAAEPSWRVISNGADDSQLSSDVESLRCDGDICAASEKTSYLRPLPNGASSVEDDVEYDCRKALTRTLGEALFDADGQQIKRTRGASPWLPVGLGTVGFESMRFACREGQGAAAVAQAPELAGSVDPRPAVAKPSPAPQRASLPPQPVVQLVSSPTEAGARGVLRDFVEAHPEAAKLTGGVERAVTHGHVTYFAVVSGFPSRKAAAAFCSRVREKGGDCVARLAGM